MPTLNTKGFSVVEGLLAVIAITLLIGVGFYIKNSQIEDKQTASTSKNTSKGISQNDTSKVQPPAGWQQYKKDPLQFHYPVSWSVAPTLDRDEVRTFKDSKTGATIAVYVSGARIYYSSNAPYFCQLNNGVWQGYEYGMSDPPALTGNDDPCRLIEEYSESGNKIHFKKGGALGQFRHTAVVELKPGYLVVQNSRDFPYEDVTADATSPIDKELEREVKAIASELARAN